MSEITASTLKDSSVSEKAGAIRQKWQTRYGLLKGIAAYRRSNEKYRELYKKLAR